MGVEVLYLFGLNKEQIDKLRFKAAIPSPDYTNDFLTKTPPAMSEEEYTEAIKQMAIKDAKAGKWYSTDTKIFKRDYVSVVSPDRRAIISKGIRQLSAKNKGTVLFASFKDADGNVVGNYNSEGGWYYTGTQQELARGVNFATIYREAYFQYQNAGKQGIDVRA